MIIEKVLKIIKPEKQIQRDVFDWYEEGIWKASIIKCKDNKNLIYVDSYFDDETEKFYIEYYIK
ncbi:hypothetical protein BFS35_012295 [Macrococcoides goetzii]|uniref:Uncharacterized protein n=1 Tax=Macrococcoides goetzii TaxID=1891097 RepID=A0A2G5NVA6_9STAP|nr:hypothetical protein [Macrococcus goetzii]RAI79333.1 hypothetical protein BFS35_012295 [Macrococcus goetzii]